MNTQSSTGDFSATPDRRTVASEHVNPERAEKTAHDANPPSFLPTPRTKAFLEYLNQQFPATKGHIPIIATVGKMEMDLAEALDRLSRADTNIRHLRERCGKLQAQSRIDKQEPSKHDPSTDQWPSSIPSEIFEAARKVHTFFAQQGKAKWEFGDIADRALVVELKSERDEVKADFWKAVENAGPCGACAEGIACGSTMHAHVGCPIAELTEARAQIAALRTALEIQLDLAENADETGYVTDVGFIDLDAEREKARILLAETKPKEEK